MKKYFLLFFIFLFSCIVTPITHMPSPPKYEKEFFKKFGAPYYWTKDSFPLLIVYADNNTKIFKDAIEHASYVWNKSVDKTVFLTIEVNQKDEFLKKYPHYRIIPINMEQINKITTLGYTKYYFFGFFSARLHSSRVAISNHTKIEDYPGVLIHELGHVLGLKHDNKINSIMYHQYDIRKNAIIEPNDLFLIREMLK